jgi:hypothetical protein
MCDPPDRSPTPSEVEVGEAFAAYERALVANDVDAMDGWFLDAASVIRFGIAEVQFGAAAIREWRRTATPVPTSRRLTTRCIEELGPGVVAVDVTFANGDAPGVGRQSQTWLATPEGWRIGRAHVSMIA